MIYRAEGETGLLHINGGRKVTGVPPGLQNQCWAPEASWVGSIPTCLRQRENEQAGGIFSGSKDREGISRECTGKEETLHKGG